MAKIDTQLAAIEVGFQSPEIKMGTAWVPDEQMETLGVRRKKATTATQHRLFYLSIGEIGQAPATFWGHKLTDALIKALQWRNLPTKNKRGPRTKAAE